MSNLKKITIFVFIVAIAGAFFWLARNQRVAVEPVGTIEINPAPTPIQTSQNLPAQNNATIAPPNPLPKKISIAVPWTSQAPFGVWDARHEDACEEASIIMVKYWLDKNPLTPEIAEREIQKMIDYELKNFERFEDSDAAEMVKIAVDFYGIKNMRIVYDFGEDDLKKYLAKGQPIIVPAAGRMLGNPNYKQPGPLYHALVLIGYDGNRIITNDPGTRKGGGYKYNIDTLYNAIHDFPGKKEEIERGRKAMIVLE